MTKKAIYYLITKTNSSGGREHVCVNVYNTEKDDRGGWAFLVGGFHDMWTLENTPNSYRQSLLQTEGGYPNVTAKRICRAKVRKLFEQHGKTLTIF